MAMHQLLAITATKLIARDQWDNAGDDDENSNCVTAVPGVNGNVPVDACNSYYNYDPQFAPAVAVAALFGIFTGVHIFEAIAYKKRYAWVVIMGSLWETIAFVLHSLGSHDQQQIAYATGWNLLFLLAPLWINAFVYMTFARMVYFFLPNGKVGPIKAESIAKLFVWADVLTFLVQAVGGSMASPGAGATTINNGLKVYVAGMVIQQIFIITFTSLMAVFQTRCNKTSGYMVGQDGVQKEWKPVLFALYGVLIAITVRIIYRICEFAGGITPSNPVPFHEAYSYALDCFPMMVALLILATWHPGRYLVGPHSEFPRQSRKEKKAAKQAKRHAKKAARKQKKLGQDNGIVNEQYEVGQYNHQYGNRQ